MRSLYYTQGQLKQAESDAYSKGVDDTLKSVLEVTIHILDSKFGFKKEDIDKFAKEFNYTTDSLLEGYINFNDVENTNTEEIYGGNREQSK